MLAHASALSEVIPRIMGCYHGTISLFCFLHSTPALSLPDSCHDKTRRKQTKGAILCVSTFYLPTYASCVSASTHPRPGVAVANSQWIPQLHRVITWTNGRSTGIAVPCSILYSAPHYLPYSGLPPTGRIPKRSRPTNIAQ
jgi:hypothetical protein